VNRDCEELYADVADMSPIGSTVRFMERRGSVPGPLSGPVHRLARDASPEKQIDGRQRSHEMLDFIFIALVLVFFGIAFWYVRFCERV
jgi:hypothetical protein